MEYTRTFSQKKKKKKELLCSSAHYEKKSLHLQKAVNLGNAFHFPKWSLEHFAYVKITEPQKVSD